MQCPFCHLGDSRVISSREGAGYIRRRRVCPDCGQRFTTHEYLTQPHLLVVKNDGRREPFDREKLARGIQIACAKRPVSAEAIEGAVAAVEVSLLARGEAEIPSREIGELVLNELSKLDPVAYVRFASVYRQFPDLLTLQQAVGQAIGGLADRLVAADEPAADHRPMPAAS
ncbi:MAG: transcriptional regulator NrdR [Dehalococcoidia bacterium]